MASDNHIILFEEKGIRRVWHNEQWYFAITDVIEILTETPQPRRYWNTLKKKILQTEGGGQLLSFMEQLKVEAADKKKYATDVANTKGVLRIIMSVPSPKAEPFKQWLAQIGEERIEEFENPEIAFERAQEIYRAKGYSEEWIKNRLQTIETRKLLTDEWKQRGIKESRDYSILTALIAKGTFGLTPGEHAKVKGLERENLRDHMSPLELIFSALGEEVTRRLAIQDDAQGFNENRDIAVKGGHVAGDAVKRTEAQTGLKVVTSENFLKQIKGDAADNTLPPDEKK